MLKRASVFAVALLATAAAGADEIIRLAPGASAIVAFPENPSTGYSWRIDGGASEGLDRLTITDGGRLPGASAPGAPGVRRWTVRALAPGTGVDPLRLPAALGARAGRDAPGRGGDRPRPVG